METREEKDYYDASIPPPCNEYCENCGELTDDYLTISNSLGVYCLDCIDKILDYRDGKLNDE